MAVEFKLPELGENIESGDVVSVLVKEGDVIAADQSVLELETDKATVEVPSNVGGKVTKVHVSQGDQVKVGQTVLSLEASEQPAETPAEKTEPESVEPETAAAASQEAAAESESEQVPPSSVPAAEPRRTAPAPARARAEIVDFRERRTVPSAAGGVVPASPAVRRFAREIGIDVAQVRGSGSGGRISVEDVKAFSKALRTGSASTTAVPVPELPDFAAFGPVRREAFSNVRRTTARRLATAWANVAQVTNHDRADVTQLDERRKSYAARVEAEGGKLTVTAILLKTVAAALKVFPKFNASLDMGSEQIVYKEYFNIGVAVDTPRGLLVPVVRDVDQKNILQLAIELKETAERARQGKIPPEQLQGGCFTITNLGGIGGTYFTPIVNFPEVAIMGVSRTQVEPVYLDGQFEPRRMLPLSLSYDHRLIDGADAARFLRWLVEALEDPFFALLEG
jgi:pyruvate dehydrogenase E2 component (dihydrolipoamide acetyltransferase)